jgi:pyruvate dehydrogenase E1 component beta subunit
VPLPIVPAQILDKDFLLPIGKAKVMRQGSQVTLTAFSKMVGVCLDAAQQLAKEGIEAEVRQQDRRAQQV